MTNVEQYIVLQLVNRCPGIERQEVVEHANDINPYDTKVYGYHLDSLVKTGMIHKYNVNQYEVTSLGRVELAKMVQPAKSIGNL